MLTLAAVRGPRALKAPLHPHIRYTHTHTHTHTHTLFLSTLSLWADPCVNTLKQLSVSLAGSCASVLYEISVDLPVGGAHRVDVDLAGKSAAAAVVVEAVSGAQVWKAGAYVPGVVGVTGAAVSADGSAVQVFLGGGEYKFEVLA